MQGGEQRNFLEQSARSDYQLSTMQPQEEQKTFAAFGINATMPPPLDPHAIIQRADEVNAIQRMLSDTQGSAIILTGHPGAGKSTLAALVYNRFLRSKQAGLAWPAHLVWLSIGPYTTLPDVIDAILTAVNMRDPGLFLLKPEQQISTLLRALRRSHEDALIVLDRFELLLYPEANRTIASQNTLLLFLDMLRTDLGASRILLTSYDSPYDTQGVGQARVRSYLVSHTAIPDGITLLQRRGVKGSPDELSQVWQRCAGHVFSLILLSAILRLGGMTLSQLLNAPEHRALWAGEVTSHLIATVYRYLNPIQYLLMRTLSLFSAPVSLQGVITTITGASSKPTDRPYVAIEHELNTLTQLSLIQVMQDANGQPTYMLHPLLRQYITEHYLEGYEHRQAQGLAALGVTAPPGPVPSGPEARQMALAAGHLQLSVYYQSAAREHYVPRAQRKGLHDIEPLIFIIRHLCLAMRSQQACDILFQEGLHESMVRWGAWSTLIELYAGLLPPQGTLRKRDEALIASHVGTLYGRMGEYQQSHTCFERALSIQREIGDQRGEATTLANEGEIFRIQGEYEEARSNFERALTINERQRDVNLQCILLHNLGLVYHNEKNYQQAFTCYQNALKFATDTHGAEHTGMILTNLGLLLYEQGLHSEGISLLLAALRIRQSLQDPTITTLELFLKALEQKMGTDSYAAVCRDAQDKQQQVFSRFVGVDMRK
jgi:tetratricopeptide (TPR) repeat protein/energy-coupling factor transporter ATP-binding protein EcfA2